MTHGHVKKFLQKVCGYDDWTDVPLLHRSGIFSLKPNGPYPDWDETEVKSFGDCD